jgi:hypothetical protein
VIVGAKDGNPTDTPELPALAPPFGRLPVDDAIVPPVDRHETQMGCKLPSAP